MNIIVDNSGYGLDNVGDFAMLQVAITRLRTLFPKARIQVFTEHPELLHSLCPDAEALELTGRNLLFQRFNILGKIRVLVPQKYHEQCIDFENRLRQRLPGITTRWICYRLQKRGENCEKLKEFQRQICKADLIVGTGGGYINDSFARHAKRVLLTLGLAQQQHKPTVLFGQGIGPLTAPGLKKIARDILPKVDLIGLREGLQGPGLLAELGVSTEKITVTGDDAIELIQPETNLEIGNNVGINIRIANYSNVTATHINTLRAVLDNFVSKVRSGFTAVPIAFGPKDNDLEAIYELISSDNIVEHDFSKDRFPAPHEIIQAVRMCRIVVTGSYHAGVFALSQGIPIVSLSASEYYVSKFRGLEKQFQQGVEHVILTKTSFATDLEHALEKAWNCSPSVRIPLIQAAKRQVQAGNDFYTKVQNLISNQISA